MHDADHVIAFGQGPTIYFSLFSEGTPGCYIFSKSYEMKITPLQEDLNQHELRVSLRPCWIEDPIDDRRSFFRKPCGFMWFSEKMTDGNFSPPMECPSRPSALK